MALDKTAENVFDLSTVRELITTPKEVILSPSETQTMPGISKIMGHIKRVHVITEPREQSFPNKVVASSTYSDLKPQSIKVKICLQNLTLKRVVITTQCVIAQIQAANEVPTMYAPVIPKGHLMMGATVLNNENWPNPLPAQGCGEGLSQSPFDTEPKIPAPDRTILKKINMSGCASWSLEDFKEAADLLSEFVGVFFQHDLDLGETSVV